VSALQAELVELARANRYISEAQERIAFQRAALQRAYDHGWPTKQAHELLAAMERSLSLMEVHRDLIHREIALLRAQEC
jgi:hypothetical protein